MIVESQAAAKEITAGRLGCGQCRIVQRQTGNRQFRYKDDMQNAAATWVDESAVREGNLVGGGVVADIPDYCRRR